MTEICIVTGADARYFYLLRGMLNSLAVNNDLDLPVVVMDMGLQPTQIEWLQDHPLKVRVRPVGPLSFLDGSTADFRKITTRPGALAKVENWFSKLNILYMTEFERLFWVDADCLILEPISSILPNDRHVAFSATRARQTLGFEFKQLLRPGVDPIAPDLLDEFVVATSANTAQGQLFNSGVMYFDPESLRNTFEQFRLPILNTFWFHARGDQTIFILIVLCMKYRFEHLPKGVNIAPKDQFKVFEIRTDGQHPGAYMQDRHYSGNVKLLHMISSQKPTANKIANPSITDLLFRHYCRLRSTPTLPEITSAGSISRLHHAKRAADNGWLGALPVSIDLSALLTSQPHRRYAEFDKILKGLISSSVKAQNFYELVLADLIATLVKRGDTVIDVGANVGKHTLNFLRALCGQGKCIAIEPNPKMAQIITDRLKRYRHGNLCELVNVAVSDRQMHTLPFYTVPARPAVSRFNPTADFLERHETKIIHVPVRRLDDIVSSGSGVTFLKIDVEGHEAEVLSGARELIQSHRPYIFFECNLPKARAASKDGILLAGLETMRYRLFSAFGDWVNTDTVNRTHPTNFFAYPVEREPLALSRLHSAIMQATLDVLFVKPEDGG